MLPTNHTYHSFGLLVRNRSVADQLTSSKVDFKQTKHTHTLVDQRQMETMAAHSLQRADTVPAIE